MTTLLQSIPQLRVLLRNQLHNDSASWLDSTQDKLDSNPKLKATVQEAFEEFWALDDPEFALSTFSCWIARVLEVENPLALYCQTDSWTGWWGPKFVATRTVLKLRVD